MFNTIWKTARRVRQHHRFRISVELGLQSKQLVGRSANTVPIAQPPDKQQTYRQFYESVGWTTAGVFRADTRHELDMPLQVGDAKITPYVTGRVTFWDDGFADANQSTTTRVWGGGGVRTSMQFWRVYENAESRFFDVHEIRHIIEPQFNIFVGGATQDRKDLQQFDRDVEGISGASGSQLSINQKWQTKRGGEGITGRDVDWLRAQRRLESILEPDDQPLLPLSAPPRLLLRQPAGTLPAHQFHQCRWRLACGRAHAVSR